MQDGARLRRVRVVRDYGMFDRREAPQYYPDVKARSEDFDAMRPGIAGGAVFMNYDVRESAVHISAAFQRPEFKKTMEDYPSSAVVSPDLFTRLSVSNLCVGL